MSDELTHPRASAEGETGDTAQPRAGWRLPAVQGLTIVVLFAAVGAFCGWLWERLWTPATGIVWDGRWNKGLVALDPKTFAQSWSENAHQDVFSATAIYVVVAAVAGLLVGALAAFLLDASELVTLGALVVGGMLAGFVMERLGLHLSAPDPNALAPSAANGTVLDNRIHLESWGLWAVFPCTAMLALALIFLIFDRPGRRAAAEAPDQEQAARSEEPAPATERSQP